MAANPWTAQGRVNVKSQLAMRWAKGPTMTIQPTKGWQSIKRHMSRQNNPIDSEIQNVQINSNEGLLFNIAVPMKE